ncbi:MAG: DUF1684 domain-containing protein [Verrucomicrobia bacterium]|nr:DUF1684 domain-containing protein [Cytophagales bacterium]
MKKYVSVLLFSFLFMGKQITFAQDTSYTKQILQERSKKNIEFKDETHSPLEAKQRQTFQELAYFPLDESFKVEAIFIKNEDPKPFQMKTSTERLPVYVVFGKVKFQLQGKDFELNVYQSRDLLKKPGFKDYLFIPFTDQTSGNETYGGGRYIDCRIPQTDTLLLDFNTAYNPYCAYSHTFSCPIPPKINKLRIKVLAGEKNFEKEEN